MKKFNFKINGNQYVVDVKSVEANMAEVEVNGTVFSIELEKKMTVTKTPTIVRSTVVNKPEHAEIPKVNSDGKIKKVESPLPGSIFKILVKEGDLVKVDDVLIIVEAMKMENSVLSEVNGTVKEIKVTVGTSVLQGETLLTIV
jgi:biotin carboxyl carrier protein